MPGLGADGRVFDRLDFPPAIQVRVLHWIQPKPSESLESYAGRLLLQIEPNIPFAIAGVSFGGIVVQEMAKIRAPWLMVVISSVTANTEVPLPRRVLFKWGALFAPLLSPHRWPMPSILRYAFGVKSPEDLRLVLEMVEKTDPALISWCAKKLYAWPGVEERVSTVQIHGRHDRVFPYAFTTPDIQIDGGHFAVYTNGKGVSAILTPLLLKHRT